MQCRMLCRAFLPWSSHISPPSTPPPPPPLSPTQMFCDLKTLGPIEAAWPITAAATHLGIDPARAMLAKKTIAKSGNAGMQAAALEAALGPQGRRLAQAAERSRVRSPGLSDDSDCEAFVDMAVSDMGGIDIYDVYEDVCDFGAVSSVTGSDAESGTAVRGQAQQMVKVLKGGAASLPWRMAAGAGVARGAGGQRRR